MAQIAELQNEGAAVSRRMASSITLQISTKKLGGSLNLAISRELGLPSPQNSIFIDKINPPTPSEHGRVVAAKLRLTQRERENSKYCTHVCNLLNLSDRQKVIN